MGASQLIYVEAVRSQKLEDWIWANENAWRYYGGATWNAINRTIDGINNEKISNSWLAQNIQQEHVRKHREAFPDWTEEIKHIVAEGNFVSIHYVSRGTNEGSFQGNPATGKPIEINEMSIFRIVDGKIAEQWIIPDLLNLNQQLGFISQSN